MSAVRFDVLAIGSLAANPYWGEKTPVRREYATATLVRSEDVTLVVDPGWPAEVLRAALFYRAGLAPEAVTHVFLTHFDPAHFCGIDLFGEAEWAMFEEEIRYARAEGERDGLGGQVIERVRPAPERFAAGVDLFPTFGPSPGHCSLLVYTALATTVVAGDIVPTREHFERGSLEEEPWDLEKARQSLRDVLEIADLVVPGHDNLLVCQAGGGAV